MGVVLFFPDGVLGFATRVVQRVRVLGRARTPDAVMPAASRTS
jgi:hypothetical protein